MSARHALVVRARFTVWSSSIAYPHLLAEDLLDLIVNGLAQLRRDHRRSRIALEQNRGPIYHPRRRAGGVNHVKPVGVAVRRGGVCLVIARAYGKGGRAWFQVRDENVADGGDARGEGENQRGGSGW